MAPRVPSRSLELFIRQRGEKAGKKGGGREVFEREQPFHSCDGSHRSATKV